MLSTNPEDTTMIPRTPRAPQSSIIRTTTRAGTTNTTLTSSNSKSTLQVTNAGLGHGVVGNVSNPNGRGYGVFGTGDAGAGGGKLLQENTANLRLIPSDIVHCQFSGDTLILPDETT
jgi:hypothetical protein